MENSLKGLLMAAGTIITCLIVSLGFFIAREAKETAAGGAGQISRLNAEFNESDKVLYDNLEVSGSEVVNVINKFKDSILSIKVKTSGSSSASYYNYVLKESDTILGGESSASIKEAQNYGSIHYINPNAQFVGEVLRDQNETIIGISFTQKK